MLFVRNEDISSGAAVHAIWKHAGLAPPTARIVAGISKATHAHVHKARLTGIDALVGDLEVQREYLRHHARLCQQFGVGCEHRRLFVEKRS